MSNMSITSGLPSTANAMQASNASNASAVSVLKKSLDIQAETVAALLPTPPTAPVSSNQGLPANLGQNVNITA